MARKTMAQLFKEVAAEEKAQQQQVAEAIKKDMHASLPAGVQGPVQPLEQRWKIEEKKARDTARNNYIYGKADASKFTYQTPAEYDAEIAKLQSEFEKASQIVDRLTGKVIGGSNSEFSRMLSNDPQKAKEIQSKIDALKAERTLLERETRFSTKYAPLMNNPDFAVNSVERTPQVDYPNESREYIQNTLVNLGNTEPKDQDEKVYEYYKKYGAHINWAYLEERVRKGYNYMTDEERAVYNYLYNTAGYQKASQYLSDMEVTLARRRALAKEFDETEEYNQSSDWGKFGKNVETLVTSPIGAVVSALDDLGQAVSVSGKEYNPYTWSHDLTAYTDTVRGATAQEIYQGVYESTGSGTTAQLVSTFYQSGMSAADAIVGSAALGQYYLLVAGANAATHKAKELYESGAEGYQIAFGSVASGVIEVVAEKIPLDELWKMTGGTKGVRQIVYNVIRQMGLEGTEEGLTEIGNTIADCIIQGGNSDLSRQIAAYENEGYDPAQAKQMAFRDKAVDVAWSYAGGMLAGGPSAAVFSTVGSVRDYQQTKSVGNAILADGQQLQAAITAGLHTAPNTDAHKIAVAVQTKLASGDSNKISAYQVGEMVRNTLSPEIKRATAIYTSVRQSAQALGVDDTTAEEIGTIAAATGRQVEFVRPEDLQIVGPNGVSIPEGRYTSDGRVQLNAAMPAERLTGYLIKHELTHSIENTAQWDQLVQIVRSGMGEQAFTNAVNEVTQRYAANNETLTDRGAQREVVAQWVGQNLFQNGFAQAIVSGNASVGNAFVRTLDKLRLALGGTKNSRTASNIALVERLFMRALQNAPSQNNEGQQYVIVALANGKIYVQADRNVLSGDDPKIWEQQIDTFFDNVLLANGSLTVESIEGDTLTITKDQTVWKGKDDHDLEKGQRRPLRKNEYRVKLSALSHIDELAEASFVERNSDGSRKVEPDKKNHPFAKDGFEYRTVFFRDLDGKYYRITLSVGLNDGVSTVYNVGKRKEKTVPEGSIISAIGSKAQGTVFSDTTVSQNSFGVNNYSMQSGGENSQFSFGDASEGDLTTPPPSDAANSQALGNLGESTPMMTENVPGDNHRSTIPGAEFEFLDNEIAEQVVGAKERRLTKAEQSRRDERAELLARRDRGEISDEEYSSELTRLDRAASEETARKYRHGDRGSAVQKAEQKSLKRELREDIRSREAEKKASKERTEMRHKIQTKVDEIYSRLRAPTKNRYVPRDYVPVVEKLLGAVTESDAEAFERTSELKAKLAGETDPRKIDRLKKRIENIEERHRNLTENLHRLRSTYASYNSHEKYDSAFNKEVFHKLASITEAVQDRSLGELADTELEEVLNAVNAVTKAIVESQKLKSAAYTKDVQETGENMIEETEEAKSLGDNLIQRLVNWQLTPDRFFEMLGGFKKNSTWGQVLQSFIDGQKQQFETLRLFDEHFREITSSKELDKIASTKEKNLVNVGLLDADGKPILITRDMMLSLHQMLSCEANRQEIIYGGIQVPDLKTYYRKGGGKEAYSKGQRISRSEFLEQLSELNDRAKEANVANDFETLQELNDEIVRITALANQSYDRVLENIEKQMTPFEKIYCKLAREWFDGASKRLINETTEEVLGFPRAVVQNYYPIHRDTDFVSTDFDQLIRNLALENSGFLKTRVHSRAPLLLTGLSAELALSGKNVSTLRGFLKPTIKRLAR